MTIRKAAVAGQFYESGAEALRRRLSWCFEHALGPGALPQTRSGLPRETVGLVCPHAGLMYSGPAAACAWAALAQDGRPSVIVILCPNHRGIGPEIAVSGAESWETPLGPVSVDSQARERLLKEFPAAAISDAAHMMEHSIEVQLPFIRLLFGDAVPILPVALTPAHHSAVRSARHLGIFNLGEALVRACRKGAVIAASSDMTHQQPADFAQQQDRKAIERIEALDPQGLLETVDANAISTCGPLGVAAMLRAAAAMGARRARLLRYHTSGDTAPGLPNVVGYAALSVAR